MTRFNEGPVNRSLPVAARRAVRAAVGNTGRGYQYPVVVIAGRTAPEFRGTGFYHTTVSGKTIVRHPGAYGWRTLYHASTRRIVVGREWLAAAGF